MGFLSFRKKSKANKALIAHSPPPPPSLLVLNDNVNTATTATTDAESDYHSPIADSFMMVGSSIVDMAQSSLSEDIFKELVPLSSIKSESSTKDTIRHSLSLKSSNNNNSSVKSSVSPLKVNTAIHVHNDSAVQSPLNESIISSTTTRSSKQSGSSGSSLTSLSSTEEFVPLHPISRSDPRHYASKKLGEHAPLIDLVNRSSPHEQQVVAPTMPSATTTTATTVPGLAMERMKERHRQEYRRSMQWSPPTQSLPNAPPPPSAAMMEYHSSSSKRANSSTRQRTLSMQQHMPPLPPPPPPHVHAQVQVPLIDQIKPVAVPMRSMSSSTYTPKPFDKRPLIASIPPLVSYQQPTKPVPDHRHYRLSNQVQPHPSAAAMQYQQAETRHPRQQRFMGGGSISEQPYQQEPSKSSKLKTDYRRIVYTTRKQNYAPDLVDLLDHQDEQQQQQQASFSHCSHHQPHHTLIKRHYKNTDSCQQPTKQPQQHHYPATHRCNHHQHRHYTHCHHNRKPTTCYDYNTTCC